MATPFMEDLTGKQLGAYQVLAPLGEGGMAAVYRAYQPSVDREVVLKILPRHFASDPQFVARFEQEAKILARLQHPHILPVFDYGIADGYTYIVMPYVKGGTLAQLLQQHTPLPLPEIARIISQIGEALDYAHAQGLVHRDVKPSNVLIDERNNCLLSDFGIAKILESNTYLTGTDNIIGTPMYMSTEQAEGKKVDARSDIYSLGIILYEMATGKVPYSAETPMAVIIKHLNDPLPLPRIRNPLLPEALERIILKALAKRPEERFASAREMVRAILNTIQVQPTALEDKPTVVLSAEQKNQLPSAQPQTLSESPANKNELAVTVRYKASTVFTFAIVNIVFWILLWNIVFTLAIRTNIQPSSSIYVLVIVVYLLTHAMLIASSIDFMGQLFRKSIITLKPDGLYCRRGFFTYLYRWAQVGEFRVGADNHIEVKWVKGPGIGYFPFVAVEQMTSQELVNLLNEWKNRYNP